AFVRNGLLEQRRHDFDEGAFFRRERHITIAAQGEGTEHALAITEQSGEATAAAGVSDGLGPWPNDAVRTIFAHAFAMVRGGFALLQAEPNLSADDGQGRWLAADDAQGIAVAGQEEDVVERNRAFEELQHPVEERIYALAGVQQDREVVEQVAAKRLPFERGDVLVVSHGRARSVVASRRKRTSASENARAD